MPLEIISSDMEVFHEILGTSYDPLIVTIQVRRYFSPAILVSEVTLINKDIAKKRYTTETIAVC